MSSLVMAIMNALFGFINLYFYFHNDGDSHAVVGCACIMCAVISFNAFRRQYFL